MKLANTVKELIEAVAFTAKLMFGDDGAIESMDAHAADTGGAGLAN